MRQITFYTHGLCPYAQRVALALQWAQLKHDIVEIDLSNKPSWYAQRLGTSLVPAIEVDGTPFTESLDICRIVADMPDVQPLLPSDAKQAAAVEEMVRFCQQVETAGWRLLGGSWSFQRGSPSASAVRSWESAVDRLARSVDAHGGPWLVGRAPTLADAALAPFLARFVLAAERVRGYRPREASAALDRYLATLEADAGWAATFPNRELFGRAIDKFCSLDYFDFHSASLARPIPE
mmetsp:Transcript_7323/g.16010  ORF Transcript_7323/g.16010 Transcript_7323/m.16010 type:complete len:236 (-) Transcript_7323:442-1149(-)|eukprot:4236266-Pleurochrysis_carterae.AAC.5